jgi:hypothetical protein
MNAYSLITADDALRLANERMQGLRNEAGIERIRSANRPGRSLFGRIAAAVSSVRTTATTVDAVPALPALSNYPYRS